MNLKNKKYLFFDLDGTLTPSRQEIKSEMASLLPSLNRTIVVVSGSQNNQIKLQLGGTAVDVFSLGQNGNKAIDTEGNLIWENSLSEKQKQDILTHIKTLRPLFLHQVPNEEDLIEDRNSQISFSIYGHNAPPAEKKACDGNFEKRKKLLSQIPFENPEVEVQMGGSTCLDYFQKGLHKGANTKRLIDLMDWNPDECVYFGDALFPGGNDASVNGVIDTVQVKDEDDTLNKLKSLLV